MKKIYNLKEQKEIRQYLRTHSTAAEAVLWRLLSNKKIDGLKFRRQFGIGHYVVDFYCPELRLAIELDGGIHNDWIIGNSDKEKAEYIQAQDITLIRFWNDVVFHDVDFVIEKIIEHRDKFLVEHGKRENE